MDVLCDLCVSNCFVCNPVRVNEGVCVGEGGWVRVDGWEYSSWHDHHPRRGVYHQWWWWGRPGHEREKGEGGREREKEERESREREERLGLSCLLPLFMEAARFSPPHSDAVMPKNTNTYPVVCLCVCLFVIRPTLTTGT